MNSIKTFSLSLINKFESIKLHKYLIGESIDKTLIILENKIELKFATQNINDVLSFYGLNSYSSSSSFIKLWSYVLYLAYWSAQIRFLIMLNLDPVNYYKLCVLLGDFTIFIETLRKFFLLVLILMVSYCLCLNRLFNYDTNTK